ALETHRRLYNTYLDYRELAYSMYGVSLSHVDCSRWFKRQRDTNPYFARINFSSAQATMRRLDKAFSAFLRRAKAGGDPGYPRVKGSCRLGRDRVPRLWRRHQADRRPAPRPARRDDQGQAASPDRGEDQDRHPEAGSREVVRGVLLRSRRCPGRAERQSGGRDRRGPGIVPDHVLRGAGAESPLPEDGAAGTPPRPTIALPEEEGREEPPEVAAEGRQDPRPGGEAPQGTSPPSCLEVGPSLRVHRGRELAHHEPAQERPVGPRDQRCRLVRLPA